jgi:hypothetical protein
MHIAQAGLRNKKVKTTTPFICRQNLAPHTLYLPSANIAILAAFLSSLLVFLFCVVEGKGSSDISWEGVKIQPQSSPKVADKNASSHIEQNIRRRVGKGTNFSNIIFTYLSSIKAF